MTTSDSPIPRLPTPPPLPPTVPLGVRVGEAFSRPGVVVPIVLGAILTFLSWGVGDEGRVGGWVGVAAMAYGVVRGVWRLMTHRDAVLAELARRASLDVQSARASAAEELARRARRSGDDEVERRADALEREAKRFATLFDRPITPDPAGRVSGDAVSTLSADVAKKAVELHAASMSAMERALQIGQTLATLSTDDARQKALIVRHRLLADADAAIGQIARSNDTLLTSDLTRLGRQEADDLSRLSGELDTSLGVAREVERRVEELDGLGGSGVSAGPVRA